MRKRAIIIDSDPGNDDAVALLLALASPELDVLGVTAVAGNVSLAWCSRNARILVELAGRGDVPVMAGAARPLLRAAVSAEQVHGRTGLDGADLPEPSIAPADEDAIDFIVRTLRARPPASVTLCALGPLTNVALALMRAPEIATRVDCIVLMGGAAQAGGNVTPCAEFNFFADPHAAQRVLHSGARIVMLPLDVTHRVRATRARIAAIAALGTRCAQTVAQLLSFRQQYNESRFGNDDGAPLHDPCVIAWLLRPGLFGGRSINVEVETCSELTLGMSVVDRWGVSGRPANATFLDSVDDEGFFALLTERLTRLP